MKKISFLGAGSWASALAVPLLENNHQVMFLTTNKFQVNSINFNKQNLFSFNQPLNFENKNVFATFDYEELLKDCDVLVICVPSFAVSNVLLKLKQFINKPIIFINTAKGFVNDEGLLVSQFLKSCINPQYVKAYAALLGPSHAEELAFKGNTFVNLSTDNFQVGQKLINYFQTSYFKLFYYPSCLTCELGAVVKNMYAIGNGIINGAGYGINVIAFYVTIVMSEIKQLLKQLNYNELDILNLSWVGDYIVTGFSKFSRNFSFGYDLGKTKSFIKSNQKFKNTTVEGIGVALSINKFLKKHQINLPLAKNLRLIFENELSISDFLNAIFNYNLRY